MSDSDTTIRFIDSHYRELFKIPDGGSINIIYPPDDGRGTVTCACKFLDECHTRVGNYDYHICEFAERMEALGARYEPESQLRNVELLPFTAGEEKYFTYNREEGNTCIGHTAGDFGNDGDRFYSSWNDRENGRNAPAFQAELHSAVYALRHELLKDYDSMLAYCQSHPEAMLHSGADYSVYGFKLETDSRQYFVNCFMGEYMRDARFIAYAYDEPAPVLGREQQVNTFEYCGHHFTPVRKFRSNEGDFFEVNRRMASDRALGLSTYDEWRKADYSYEGFYAASTDKDCDIFRCEETGKLYVPAQNELFEYKKPQRNRKAEDRQSVMGKLDKAKDALSAPGKGGGTKKLNEAEL